MSQPRIRLNGAEAGLPECQYDSSHVEELIKSNDNLAAKIDSLGVSVTTLSNHHKDVIRYLLIVVCIIALGRSALDLLPNALAKAQAITSDNN